MPNDDDNGLDAVRAFGMDETTMDTMSYIQRMGEKIEDSLRKDPATRTTNERRRPEMKTAAQTVADMPETERIDYDLQAA